MGCFQEVNSALAIIKMIQVKLRKRHSQRLLLEGRIHKDCALLQLFI